MDIPDAFTQVAIERTDTNVEGDDEEALRTVINQLYTTNDIAVSEDDVNIGVLCFVAGRAYQSDKSVVNVPMSPLLIEKFLQYLSEGGT
jgi:hypothetical protein